MPTFQTPNPITVDLELGVGDISVDASEQADTVVEVLPSDPEKPGDVSAAEQTRVDLAGDRLVIRGPRGWRKWTPLGGRESVDVRISLPAGSEIQGEAAVAALRCTGRLGELRKAAVDDGSRVRRDRAPELVTLGGREDATVLVHRAQIGGLHSHLLVRRPQLAVLVHDDERHEHGIDRRQHLDGDGRGRSGAMTDLGAHDAPHHRVEREVEPDADRGEREEQQRPVAEADERT